MLSFIKCLSVLLLLTSVTVRAQYTPFFIVPDDEKQRTFYGGFAAGANFSQVDGDGYSGYHKVGLNIGPQVYVRFNRFFSASMELLFTQKGSRARSFQNTSSGLPYQDQYDIKLNYVEVPLIAHLFVHGRIHYGAGISYGRLISSKEEAYTVYPVNIYSDVNYFKKDDLSGIGEVNFEFFKGWFANLRFNYSLRTIRDPMRIPQGYGSGKFDRQINNVWSIRLMHLIK